MSCLVVGVLKNKGKKSLGFEGALVVSLDRVAGSRIDFEGALVVSLDRAAGSRIAYFSYPQLLENERISDGKADLVQI